jgi:hypothetical protein
MPPEMVQGYLEYNQENRNKSRKYAAKTLKRHSRRFGDIERVYLNNVTDLDQELVSPDVSLTLLGVFPEGRQKQWLNVLIQRI